MPSLPTHLYQLSGDVVSIDNLLMHFGSIDSLYETGCCANSSLLGMLSTLVGLPNACSFSRAWRIRPTSDPLDMSTAFGAPPVASARTYAPLANPLAAA